MAWGDPWGAPWGALTTEPHTAGTVPGAAADAGEDPPVLDVASLVRARVITRLRRSPLYTDLANWIGAQCQPLETEARVLRTRLPLTDSYGIQLDREGYGLGLPRNGLGDDHYREALIVRWSALFRTRTTALTYDILRMLIGDSSTTFEHRRMPPASYEVTLFDIDAATAARWNALLRTAKPEGVRFYTNVVEDTDRAFRFDSELPGFGFDDPLSRYAYTLE